MSNAAVETGKQSDRTSPLRWSLLALLVERENQRQDPVHAYKLAQLLKTRFGPAWKIEPQVVYGLLDRLLKDDLVVCCETVHSDKTGSRRVYRATPSGRAAVIDWQRCSVSMGLLLVDKLRAKIVASSPEDVPRLLRELDDHEHECTQMLKRTTEAEVSMSSWLGVTMHLARVAAIERLQGELRWNVKARGWIADFLEQPGCSTQ